MSKANIKIERSGIEMVFDLKLFILAKYKTVTLDNSF